MGSTITAAKIGSWSATDTWNGGVVPGEGDLAELNNFAVTLDIDTLASIANTAGGSLVLSGNRTIGSATVPVTITGKSGTLCTLSTASQTLAVWGQLVSAGGTALKQTGTNSTVQINNGTNTVASLPSGAGIAFWCNATGGTWTLTGNATVAANSYAIYNQAGTGTFVGNTDVTGNNYIAILNLGTLIFRGLPLITAGPGRFGVQSSGTLIWGGNRALSAGQIAALCITGGTFTPNDTGLSPQPLFVTNKGRLLIMKTGGTLTATTGAYIRNATHGAQALVSLNSGTLPVLPYRYRMMEAA